ncbi:MAG: hypothetical protein ACNA8P_03090 [Phycisphaerales bacterium]
MTCTKHLIASLLAATSTAALSTSVAYAGGDGEKGDCQIRKVTPDYNPELPGELGDTMGILAISEDGRYVAYSTYTTNGLPNADQMHGHIQQIVVRDTYTQQGELITAAYNPKPGETISANAFSEWYVDMSPNGRYVAFASYATNLVEQDVSGEFLQLYVRDRHEQKTYLASQSTEGEIANDWGSDVRMGVSDNGRVAFASRANVLDPEQPQIMWAVYVHDIHTGETQLVSRDEWGFPAQIDSFNPSISADGNTVAFVSWAQLTADAVSPSLHVYVRELDSGLTELISKDDAGQDRNGAGYFPRLSRDGQRVAFRFDTFEPPLDFNFPAGYADVIYMRDRQFQYTQGISKTWDNQPVSVNPEGGFTISADGRYMAWDTIEPVLPIDYPSQIWHVYRTELDSLETDLVTLDRYCRPVPEGHDQMYSAISGDGSHVVFNSMWNILEEDTFDWHRHLYVWADPDSQPPTGLPGDVNGDGAVDLADLNLVLANFGTNNPAGDANGDGVVDLADLNLVLANFGNTAD